GGRLTISTAAAWTCTWRSCANTWPLTQKYPLPMCMERDIYLRTTREPGLCDRLGRAAGWLHTPGPLWFSLFIQPNQKTGDGQACTYQSDEKRQYFAGQPEYGSDVNIVVHHGQPVGKTCFTEFTCLKWFQGIAIIEIFTLVIVGAVIVVDKDLYGVVLFPEYRRYVHAPDLLLFFQCGIPCFVQRCHGIIPNSVFICEIGMGVVMPGLYFAPGSDVIKCLVKPGKTPDQSGNGQGESQEQAVEAQYVMQV